MSATIVDVIRQHTERRATRTAFTLLGSAGEPVDQLTYQELDARAQQLGAYLQARHPKGSRALVVFPISLDFIVAFLGCQYAGLVPVPISAYARKPHHMARIKHVSMDAGVVAVVAPDDYLPELMALFEDTSSMARPVAVSLAPAEAAALPWRHPDLTPEALAFLQYTSGSTGQPKGVMVSHGNLMHNSELIKTKFKSYEDIVSGSWLPFYHDMGLIGSILQPLYVGGVTYLMAPETFIKRPQLWLQTISKYKLEASGGPNFAYDHCVFRVRHEDMEGVDLSSWRVCFNGAEPIRLDTLRRFAQRFSAYGFNENALYPCYGLAETTLFVSGGESGQPFQTVVVDKVALQSNQVESPRSEQASDRVELVSSGSVSALDVAIVQPDSHEVLVDDEVGEIWVAGGSVAVGYWANEAATQESFGQTLPGRAGRYVRTGDLGFFHLGELFITGRLKDLIVVNGRNLYPQDLERRAAALSMALMKGIGAAFPIAGERSEEVVLVQELDQKDLPYVDLAALSSEIMNTLAAEFEVKIAQVVFVPLGGVPRTTSGKVQRRLCRERWLKQELRLVVPDAVEAVPS